MKKKQYVNQKIKKGAYESKGAYKIAHKFTPSFRFSDFTYCFFINPLQKSNKKSILQTFIDFEKGRSISAQISNEGGLFFVKKMRRPSSVSRFTFREMCCEIGERLNLVFVHYTDSKHSVKCVVTLTMLTVFASQLYKTVGTLRCFFFHHLASELNSCQMV